MAQLDELYLRYNRVEYVSPDPLQFLAAYTHPGDREIVGLIASSLAFGNVKQILRSVSTALGGLESPRAFLMNANARQITRLFASFRHRYASGDDLTALLLGTRAMLEQHGALGTCFAQFVRPEHDTVLPALTAWTETLRLGGGKSDNCLLPSPAKGSACKRLNLFLRWMVRCDAVDPGGWSEVPASKLIIPLDTHMYRIALRLGFTARKQADMKTALEITERFRRLAPEDPVRYDFALTRLGIRDDTDMEAFLARCAPRGNVTKRSAS